MLPSQSSIRHDDHELTDAGGRPVVDIRGIAATGRPGRGHSCPRPRPGHHTDHQHRSSMTVIDTSNPYDDPITNRTRRNRRTKTEIVVVDRTLDGNNFASGIAWDTAPNNERWATMCVTHNATTFSTTHRSARDTMSTPWTFCEPCAVYVNVNHTEFTGNVEDDVV